MNRNILFLSLAFGLIFFSFSGTQQFVTVLFEKAGRPDLGYWSLGLIYISLMVSNFFAARLIPKVGLKNLMIWGSISYSIYILAIGFSWVPVILFTSLILGFGAALLWNAQGVYLVAASTKNKTGEAAGFFSTVWGLASFAGVLVTGLVLDNRVLSDGLLFGLLGLGPILGIGLLSRLGPIGSGETAKVNFSLAGKLLSSPTLWRLAMIWIVMVFVQTVGFSSLPVIISREIGIGAVGILGSVFPLAMAGFSLVSGKISDRFGRAGITNLGLLLLIIGSVLLFWSGKTVLILASLGLALGFALLRAVTFALVGDIAVKKLLPAVNAYLYVLMNISVVAAIAIGGLGWLIFLKVVMVSSTLITLALASPVLRQPIFSIRGRIKDELEDSKFSLGEKE